MTQEERKLVALDGELMVQGVYTANVFLSLRHTGFSIRMRQVDGTVALLDIPVECLQVDRIKRVYGGYSIGSIVFLVLGILLGVMGFTFLAFHHAPKWMLVSYVAVAGVLLLAGFVRGFIPVRVIRLKTPIDNQMVETQVWLPRDKKRRPLMESLLAEVEAARVLPVAPLKQGVAYSFEATKK